MHRDLKPANVLITRTADGGVHVEICDFNLAREFPDMAVDTEKEFGEDHEDGPRPATPPPAAAAAPAAAGLLAIPGRNSPPPLGGPITYQGSLEVVSAGYACAGCSQRMSLVK